LLGTLQTLLNSPERFPGVPYLAIVEFNEGICAIALQTASNSLQLSKIQDFKALSLIAQDLQQENLPGVVGLMDDAKAFVQIWQTLTGQSHQLKIEMRLYQLTQVEPIPLTGGNLRLATECDRALLIKWVTAFESEIELINSPQIERIVDLALKRQSVYLWEDGAPVSLVGHRPISPTAARINLVYTPLEFRCQGYATAAVATLTQKLLDQGCDRCFLFTDLANPTSNHIYQMMGYSPICDWYEYSFLRICSKTHDASL
jgi:uncharacterized protein